MPGAIGMISLQRERARRDRHYKLATRASGVSRSACDAQRALTDITDGSARQPVLAVARRMRAHAQCRCPPAGNAGAFVASFQEGRGIGLGNKIKAYSLQEVPAGGA